MVVWSAQRQQRRAFATPLPPAGNMSIPVSRTSYHPGVSAAAAATRSVPLSILTLASFFDDNPAVAVQGYTNTLHHQISSSYPSNDPDLRPRSAPSLDAHAPAPVHGTVPGQSAYVGGSPGTLPGQSISATSQCEPPDLIRLAQVSPGPAPLIGDNGSLLQDLITGYSLIPPLPGPIPNDSAERCVCTKRQWRPWCARAAEHYNLAILYSSRVINHPCSCGWALPMSQIPRWCPKAASHLLDWVSHDLPMYATDIV